VDVAFRALLVFDAGPLSNKTRTSQVAIQADGPSRLVGTSVGGVLV